MDDMGSPLQPPASPAQCVVAGAEDTFCSIAVANGFPDCWEIRNLPENKQFFDPKNWVLTPGDKVYVPDPVEGLVCREVEKLHCFSRPGEPPISVQFVHGGVNDDQYNVDPKECLEVSNYQTDKAGKKRDENFANNSRRTYEEHTHADQDAFKVEVHNAQTSENSLKVDIEVLKPIYPPPDPKHPEQGKPTRPGTPTRWEPYTDGSAGRKLTAVQAERMPPGKTKADGKTHFRTCYLRLVADDKDMTARPTQTLRVDPPVDSDENRRIEILDHKIRAVYQVLECSANPKCRAIKEVVVGNGKKRVKLAVHIVRTSTNGPGEVSTDDADKHLLRYLREFYAQANLSFVFKETTRTVPPPANMFAVGDYDGAEAEGSKDIEVKVKVDGKEVTAKIKTVSGATPAKTAKDLHSAIVEKLAAAKVKADVRWVKNSPVKAPGVVHGSADIIVGDPTKQKIELSVTANTTETEQPITACVFTPGIAIDDCNITVPSVNIGSKEERLLMHNFNTGSDRIDCFIVHYLKAVWGEGFIAGKKTNAVAKPKAHALNSIMLSSDVIQGGSPAEEGTWAHEIGHVLMDDFHAHELQELMHATAPNTQDIDAAKRLADPDSQDDGVEWDSLTENETRPPLNPTKALRETMAGLLDKW